MSDALSSTAYPFLGLSQAPFRALSPLQRVILSTDGTLTGLLEAYLGEAMAVVKLGESSTPPQDEQVLAWLLLTQNAPVMERQILLRGAESGQTWLHARSYLLPERIEPRSFREQLIKTDAPIGKLWQAHRSETFKEILQWGIESADNRLAEYFGIGDGDELLWRTYRVFAHRLPAMVITEKFPQVLFRDQSVSKVGREDP